MLLIPFLKVEAFTQEHTLKFDVWRNNARIGFIYVNQKLSDQQISYQLNSEINFRILLPFQITSSEKSVFENGLLISSSVFRKINGNEKDLKSLHLNKGVYRLSNGNSNRIIQMEPVYFNLTSLYFNQPDHSKKIYLDNHQTVSKVIMLQEGKYKVPLADGAYNIYYYQNGICKQVKVVNPLFEVQIIQSN
jgi:hypothetical protein